MELNFAQCLTIIVHLVGIIVSFKFIRMVLYIRKEIIHMQHDMVNLYKEMINLNEIVSILNKDVEKFRVKGD